MADAKVKPMSTVIFFSTSPDDHVKSIETLTEAIRADERCDHNICFRPITVNFYQFIRGELDKEGHMQPIGCHEILYLPSVRTEEISRLERTKNVVLKINSMCFVGDNDKKKYKVKKIIDWLLEEREDIKL
jgi:hypothetical protein